MNEEIENIKRRVVRHPDAVDLYIKRIPKKSRDMFVEFANEEFVGDYGMALKHIMEEFIVQSQRFTMILSVLDEFEMRLNALESGKPKESKAVKGIREHLKKRQEALKEQKKEEEEKKNVEIRKADG